MNNEFTEICEQIEPIYKTTINKKVTPACIAFSIICIAISIIVGITIKNAIISGVTICLIVLIYLLFMGIVIFIMMPNLRKIQAQLDIKNYDFTPYVPNEEETIYKEIPYMICQYDLPLDTDEDCKLTFKAWYQLENYLYNVLDESHLKNVLYLDAYDDFLSFYTFGLNEDKYIAYKEARENQTIITVNEQHEIIFTDDGLKIGNFLIGYKRIIAVAEAWFTFKTYARIMLDCGNGIGANIAICPRIIALLDKFGVQINDRFIADYILANPEQAFEIIAVLNSPNRIKKYILKLQQ